MKNNCLVLGFWLLLLGVFWSACNSNSTPKAPDISHITPPKTPIERFEKALFGLDTLNLLNAFDSLKAQHSEFLPLYIFDIQTIASKTDTDNEVAQKTAQFINNPDIQMVHKAVQNAYPNLNELEQQFSTAFSYLQYYLPEIEPPQIFSFVAPFQHQALTIGTDKLGIGLDMYLGSDYEYYPTAGHANYLIQNFNQENILPTCLMAYAKALLPPNRAHVSFIDNIIYQGKLLYLVEKMLPNTATHLIIGYQTEQLEWCKNNEKEIWSFWIEKKLLYETKSGKFMRFITPAPTSAGMPPESPGNVGSFTGWQIVKAFMENNPKITMQELLKLNNGQEILKLSGYKPS